MCVQSTERKEVVTIEQTDIRDELAALGERTGRGYESTVFGHYVHAGEGRRLELERLEPGIVGLYEHTKCFDPWPTAQARVGRAIARAVLWDPMHAHGHHGDYSETARENCAMCVLQGWAPVDGEAPRGEPNYAGWARVYVQAGAAIPDGWRRAFADLLNEDTPNAHALERDIATYGLMDGRGLVPPLKPRPVV